MTVTIAILLGLSLDGFVYMMQIGATVKQLTWKKRLTYAGVYTLISCLSVAIGYGVAVLLQDAMNDFSADYFLSGYHSDDKRI